MWFIVCVGIVACIGVVLLGYCLASCQNRAIDDCFSRIQRHDKLLTGELGIQEISNSELISLSKSLWTHIGMGGVGPRYTPSFTVFRLIESELKRRRQVLVGSC